MKEPEFRVDPALYDGEIYDLINDFDFDFDFYRKWALEADGPILELCCGTGRLTIPLAQGGIDITGLDGSQPMLDHAREKAAKRGVSIAWIESDMRRFDLGRRFKGIFVPFNSLQGIYHLSDLESVLSCIRKHLDRHGILVFDLFNPDFRLMLARSEKPHLMGEYALRDGRRMVIHDRCAYDAKHQVNRVEWITDLDGRVSVSQLDVRCIFPQEIRALLKYNGFEILHDYGDFNEEPFRSTSPKQIFVCRASG